MCKNKRKKDEVTNLILESIIKERKEKIENKIQQIKNLQIQVEEELKELQYFLEKKGVCNQ